MIPSCCTMRKISRRTTENVLLYLLFVILYGFYLGSVPEKLELFEAWVDMYLPILDKDWASMKVDILSMKPNDSNQSINAPLWLLLIKLSFAVFGKTVFAYRLPDVLLTALAPVCMAEIVRRFFRADLALWSGLLVGAHQHVIAFARTGGYIGPTLTLELGIILFGMSVAFERRRKSWLPLAICLALVPFFYSTVRYLCFLGVLPIVWKFVSSKEFRRSNLLPILATGCMIVFLGLALTRGGNLDEALVFISARGEQFLITDKTVKDGFEAQTINPEHRLSGLLGTMIPERLEQLRIFYSGGKRFFLHRFFYTRGLEWNSLSSAFIALLFAGAVRCLWYARKQVQYLLFPIWSLFIWMPLLVTTGITPNRMLLGIPSDMFMILLGLCIPFDVVSTALPEKLRWVPRALMWGLILFCVSYSFISYFQDYIQFPTA